MSYDLTYGVYDADLDGTPVRTVGNLTLYTHPEEEGYCVEYEDPDLGIYFTVGPFTLEVLERDYPQLVPGTLPSLF